MLHKSSGQSVWCYVGSGHSTHSGALELFSDHSCGSLSAPGIWGLLHYGEVQTESAPQWHMTHMNYFCSDTQRHAHTVTLGNSHEKCACKDWAKKCRTFVSVLHLQVKMLHFIVNVPRFSKYHQSRRTLRIRKLCLLSWWICSRWKFFLEAKYLDQL